MADKEHEGVLRNLTADSLISVVSVMELRIGALLADSSERKMARDSFARRLRSYVQVAPFGEEEALAAAEIMVALRRAGQRIGERDLLIAATAVANGHEILALNRAEFERVPGLVVADFPGS